MRLQLTAIIFCFSIGAFAQKDNHAAAEKDGIYYMKIDEQGKQFSAKAIAYGSRLATSPETNPPFFIVETRD